MFVCKPCEGCFRVQAEFGKDALNVIAVCLITHSQIIATPFVRISFCNFLQDFNLSWCHPEKTRIFAGIRGLTAHPFCRLGRRVLILILYRP